MNVWSILFGSTIGEQVTEARKKGKLVDPAIPDNLPDPSGVIDAGTLITTTRPGETPNDTDRRARYLDFDLMDTGDIEAMLDATVDAALSFDEDETLCFKLDGTKRNALTVLEEMVDLTKLRQKLPIIARDLLKYGDAFMEHLEDKDGSIVRVQTYYPNQIYVSVDEKGNYENAAFTQLNSGNQVVAEWGYDELIHFKWAESDREPYSVKSLLDGLRTDWRTLQELEAGMVTARKTRAYPRNKHMIDVTNRSADLAREKVKNYVRAITRSTPARTMDGVISVTRTDLGVNEDLFLPTGYVTAPDQSIHPRLDDVQLLDPSLAGLSEIQDIEYVRRKMFCRIPADIVGIATGNADLAHQNIAYARLVRHLQRRLEAGLVVLFRRALLLRGIAPDRVEIVWPEIVSGQNWKFADAKFRQSMTDQIDIETGLYSRREKLRYRGHTESEIEKILQEVEDEAKAGLAVAAPQNRGSASQAADGSLSGDDSDQPKVADTPSKAARRAAQPATPKKVI